MAASRVHSRLRARWAAAVAAIALLLTGCSGNVDLDTEDPEPTPSQTEAAPRPVSEATAPEAPATLLPASDPAEVAVGVSRTYLTAAQVAILAPQGDRAAVLRAASIGAATGAPVLLSDAQPGSLDTELLRLGVVGVVTVGAVDLTQIDTTSLIVAPAPEDAEELGEQFAVALTAVEMPPGGDDADDVAALLALEPGQVFAPGEQSESSEESTSESASPSSPGQEPTAVGELPPLAPPVQVESSTVLSDGDASQVAGLGTALGVGADVVRVNGDIRGDTTAIEALAEHQPETVLGLGAGMGSEAEFGWRAATAQTGVQLPGGGQLVFDAKRYVALYGSPVTSSLGLLGEQGVEETIDRAAAYARKYDDLTDDTVVPALEIIVTVASGTAGEDGNYSNEWSSDTFLPLIEAAADAGQYVVLDFQPGRSTFLEQVQEYEDLLAFPNVGVALDPEWRLGDDQVHLQQIGSVGIGEVNDVVHYLADFVQENHLPQKVIVLHQFQLRMITDRQDLDVSRTEVALLIHADGQGSQGAKQATWRTLHEDAPDGIHWGWKNFIDEDQPMLTPAETYSDVDPVPDFVSYQ
ncbi:hypothetical protein [Pseudactinotalea sp.]|uniref:hypothetical protein n=1 Tax=Pseudactinotalea sp. TaxID=1926260 RepID=UPI003B3A87D9